MGSSCDGLVCLFDSSRAIVHIWNPSTRTAASFPIKKPPPYDDDESNERIICSWSKYDNERIICSCWKSTREFGKVNSFGPDAAKGILFNGNVHWPTYDGEDDDSARVYRTILSYDLRREMATEMRLPIDKLRARLMHDFTIGEVNGCLSVLLCKRHGQCWRESSAHKITAFSTYELWAMKEYGVEESWTKLMVFDQDSYFAIHRSFHSKAVLENRATYKSPFYSEYNIYVESLVSPTRVVVNST
ncbi:PREDICTED: F-box/kelch-repeat protein At3g23880-like [Erythranthe guttata]|uniref:F-box/kelch-repeat protein At3g23880-like n=1 Tax=Erythranthe guttata TaxID=4155 RepID=UPI00064DFE38|nr:PREDICTED: F-box/kelch-repeat protein At3g23880-like [Erythranthe guttata]|eukprot:XP_012830629.1 PREDICTED: F-box/kelch-repeat protein At3g23880-like [Erythranthe guttata]